MKKSIILTIAIVVWTITNTFSQLTCTQYDDNSSGLPDNSVTCVEIAPNGDIWVGTSSSGVAVFNGTTWTYYTEANSDLPYYSIVDIQFDTNGDVWIATGKGLAKKSGSSWTIYDSGNTIIPGLAITAFGFDASGKLWIASKDGSFGYKNAVTFDGTSWATLSALPTNAANDEMLEFAFDGGKTWIASGAGVLLYENNAYTYYPKAYTGIWSTDVAVKRGTDDIWFAGFHGILHRSGSTWTFVEHEAAFGFPQNTPYYKIIPDGDDLWIAHYKGIMKYNTISESATHWNNTNSCLPNSAVWDMARDANDIFWIATNVGLWKLDGITSAVTAVNFSEQSPKTIIYPNPISKETIVTVLVEDALKNEKIMVKVRDVYGKVQKECLLLPGIGSLDLSGLCAGNYYVELTGSSVTRQERVTVY